MGFRYISHMVLCRCFFEQLCLLLSDNFPETPLEWKRCGSEHLSNLCLLHGIHGRDLYSIVCWAERAGNREIFEEVENGDEGSVCHSSVF